MNTLFNLFFDFIIKLAKALVISQQVLVTS